MKNLLFILSLMLSTVAFARPKEELKIQHVQMEKQQENLLVNFTVEVPWHAVRSKYKQFLIPVVYHKENAVVLSGIEVVGRNRAKRIKQERFLTRQMEEIPTGLVVGENQTISYSATIPYIEWMDTLSLRIDRSEIGCCREKVLASISLIQGALLNPKPEPESEVIIPSVDTVPEQKVTAQQFVLYFRFDKAGIDTTFRDNAQTLHEVALWLKQNKGNKIELTGYSSPEGNAIYNERLAYRRAESLQHYLVDREGVNRDVIIIVGHAINWEGLRELVANSDVHFKSQVLDILSDVDDVAATNQKLQQLQGGIPYRYLLTKIYPKLRVVSFVISN